MAEADRVRLAVVDGTTTAAAVDSVACAVKVLYDFRRPNWLTYGHVVFLDAGATEAQARAAIYREDGPDVTITRMEMSAATQAERERFDARRSAYAQWLANVRSGVPNRRGDL